MPLPSPRANCQTCSNRPSLCTRVSAVSLQAIGITLRMRALLIILFGLLNITDGALTFHGLKFGSVAELNPVLDYLGSHLGLSLGYAILAVKTLVIAALAYLLTCHYRMNRCAGILALIIANIFYLWVVGNNAHLVMFS